jgi:hypothetical protein
LNNNTRDSDSSDENYDSDVDSRLHDLSDISSIDNDALERQNAVLANYSDSEY